MTMIEAITKLIGDSKFSIKQYKKGKNKCLLISDLVNISTNSLSRIVGLQPYTTGTIDLNHQTIKIEFCKRLPKRKRMGEWTELPATEYKNVKNPKTKKILLSLLNFDEDLCIMAVEENENEKIVIIRNLEPISLQSAIDIGSIGTDMQFNFELKCLVFRI